MTGKDQDSVPKIATDIVHCERCPRLRNWCKKVAKEKRKSFANETYWGKPVPAFGDPHAKLMVVGLAPAAHGANRTGRMFTGDRSGEWLYRALHRAGFANQPLSVALQDGLQLKNVYVTASARCAPPDNKPEPKELAACAPYLEREIALLKPTVYIALGKIALDALWPHLSSPQDKKPKFAHGTELKLKNGATLLLSYHPSQQNTFTGRLTEPMLDLIFRKARERA
jgi:uracil-DNA glycosylase